MASYQLKVVSIRQETNDTFTFAFKQPGLKKVKYLPGQYLTIVVNINNRKFKRPYSFSSAPGIDVNLEITVKRVQNGLVSNHLIDVVKEGDMLEVMPPMGDFFYDQNTHQSKHIQLWGAGSGVTPLMSILKYALSISKSKVTLNLCNRTKEETIFLNQLLVIKNNYPDNFNLNLYCTKENNVDTFTGRITADTVVELMSSCEDETIHFICGPVGLKENVKNALKILKIGEDSVYSEDFEHLVNEQDLEGVTTQIVDVSFGGDSVRVEVIKGKSILEACLDYGLDIPYSCQTGTCHLCKSTLMAGTVKTIKEEQTETDNLPEGVHLLCCTYPLDDRIIIKID
jgi:ring-1,2-phenylacetyl-CoA epoxidase subunit PaaE